MTTPDPVIEHALARLDELDPKAAAEASAALDWIVGDQGLSSLNQAVVQQFLWYELPFKWLMDAKEHLHTADALARFFDLAGMPRYAELCRAPQTAAIIATYETDGADAGFRAFLAAARRSGVLPDDVGGFVWSDAVGPVELDALRSTAITLELAVASGELTPGRKGWRTRQREIIRDHLERPRTERLGESWLQAIVTERIARWQDDGQSLARTQLLAAAAKQLLHPTDRPPRWTRAVGRLRWLLEHASRRGGVVLNVVGGPGPATVARYCHTFSWWDGGGSVPLDLELLQRFAMRAGLLAKRGSRLVTTPRGTAAADTPEASWAAVVATLAACDRRGRPLRSATGIPPIELTEVAFAILLTSGDAPVSWERLVRSLHVVVTELGWGGSDGQPPPRSVVEAPVTELAVLGAALGLMRWHGKDGEAISLTAVGRSAVRQALRLRAIAPKRRLYGRI
ncbi:MAG: hypothetical protein N2037_09920 [Acidimicrobiales bacterium]|nr:hypothetical protein [Acidimicrobiales bacterium]